jgi:cytochrome oxidase Cu insertion factor (SCO1/SenC/PrrC family)
MKKIIAFTMLMAFCFPLISTLQAQESKTDEKNVEVYYFHYERRCATCTNVENTTIKTLEENFTEQMQDGRVVFISVNIEDETNRALMETLKVSGQTMLFVYGDEQVDLTNDAFININTRPGRYVEKVKATVQKFLS